MTFTNHQISMEALPRLDHVEYKSLQKNYFISSVVTLVIFQTVLLIGLFVLYFFWDNVKDYALLIFFVFGLLTILLHFHNYYYFKSKGYALRQHDIIYKEGVITHSVMAIPFNRVQHSEVTQGPIDRFLNLSSLSIYTAGGSSSDLSIPGLIPEEANRLRDFIVSKTKGLDEEE